MNATIVNVFFKQTGEQIDIEVYPNTTIKDIIELVCKKSVAENRINCNDYYLVLNNSQLLADADNVEMNGILSIENPQLQMRKKTSIRREVLTAAGFAMIPVRDEMSVRLRAPVNSVLVTETNEEDKLLQNSSFDDDADDDVNTEEQQTTANTLETTSGKDVSQVSITEKWADTYNRLQTNIQEVGNMATRDPVARQNLIEQFKEINIVLCGPPRVGKSSLINAICNQKLAKTKAGLDSCTHISTRYIYKGVSEQQSETVNYRYNFWDTPGLEKWSEKKIVEELEAICSKPKSDIICMIYCASPSAFAKVDHLRYLLKECMKKEIFCALVCTNKWAGSGEQRMAVMDQFQELLAVHHPQTREEYGVTFFGNKGLCIAINTERFDDGGKPPRIYEKEGVNELILGIMESLDREKVAKWCTVVFKNKRFWKSLFNYPKMLKTLWNSLFH